jgi:hypothetical protein
MATKRVTPVVIDTPYPSAAQVVRILRQFDGDTGSSRRRGYRHWALTKWLRTQKKSPVKVAFEDIGDRDLIGMVLPYTAWDPAWWTNERSPKAIHSRAWLDAGWKVQSVDTDREVVSFVKTNAS